MMFPLTQNQERLLRVLSIFGFLVPNGAFVYFAVTDYAVVDRALANPVAFVFIVEAFVLMFVFAWLIHRRGMRPGWMAFIALSLVGSMLCSVPAFLYWASREARRAL